MARNDIVRDAARQGQVRNLGKYFEVEKNDSHMCPAFCDLTNLGCYRRSRLRVTLSFEHTNSVDDVFNLDLKRLLKVEGEWFLN